MISRGRPSFTRSEFSWTIAWLEVRGGGAQKLDEAKAVAGRRGLGDRQDRREDEGITLAILRRN